MAQIKFRANLSAANIPFISDFQSRTVIVPQLDQNIPKLQGFSGALIDNDVGIPQAYYAENVMPTAQGLQSVGFTQYIDEYTTPVTDFDQVIVLRDNAEDRFLLAPAGGICYIYSGSSNVWTPFNPAALVGFEGMVSRSYLHGQTYVFFEGVDAFIYDSSANTFTSAGFTGITVANMLGICNAINYNVLFDENTIYWSNPLLGNETDFTPNPLTGAGSIQIQEIRGNIVGALPISGGFIVYSTANAVKALYSGNPQFPWIFSEITGSLGIEDIQQVSYDANLSMHHAYTTNGLMEVKKTEAKFDFPEASAFLAGKLLETFNTVTEVLETEYLSQILDIHVTVCGNEYIVISYGEAGEDFTYAIIYDIALKRWGKVKVTHVDAFDFVNPSAFGATRYIDLLGSTYISQTPNSYASYGQFTTFKVPGKSIAFLQNNGAIQVVNFEVGNLVNSSAILYIGKFQLNRKNLLALQEIEIQNIRQGAPFTAEILTSTNGASFDIVTSPTEILDENLLRVYGSRVKGLNHTLRFRGNFNLVYLGLTVVQDANR